MNEEMSKEEDLCCICLDTNTTPTEKIQKWKCVHTFHANCVEHWNQCCPLCRTAEEVDIPPVTWSISRNPRCILSIPHIKQCGSRVSGNNAQVYAAKWKDQDCITQNHKMLFVRTYGVLGICETCTTIQSYNLMHVV